MNPAGADAGALASAGSGVDAGAQSAVGAVDAGAPPTNEAPPDDGKAMLCRAAAPCDTSKPRVSDSTICADDPIPHDPVLPAFDGGVPGPCEETSFDGNGNPASRAVSTYDPAGRVLTRQFMSSEGISAIENVYDLCGNQLWQHLTRPDGTDQTVRNHYRADGLLAQTDTDLNGRCTSVAKGYLRDDSGRIAAIYDPVACAKTQTFDYGDDGRVATLVDSTTETVRTWHFGWYPSGALHKDDLETSFEGSFDTSIFDEQGRILENDTNMGTGASSVIIGRTFKYRADGQVKESDVEDEGVGCGGDQTVNTFAGARLMHTDSTSSSGCATPVTTVTTIDYSYDGDTRTAGTRDGSGVLIQIVRSTFDSRGNEVFHEFAGTDQRFLPVFSRSFEGCGFSP